MDKEKNEYYAIGDQKKEILRTPIAVTEDDKENLYLTDAGAGIIYRYDLVKRELRPFVTFKFGRPTGIAYNRINQLLYVSDTAAHQVVAFSLDGMERMRIGTRGEEPGQFNYPTDLFVDARGELLVTDALNARIQVFSAAGALLRTVGTVGDSPGFFDKPKGVASDSEGHIYVCESLFDTVQIFDQKGRFLLNFGNTGSEAGELRMPSGIFIDRNDYIYVADTFNKRVQVFKYLKQKSAKGIGAK
jgi:DNA-binding beta-propeller fold protein YncE